MKGATDGNGESLVSIWDIGDAEYQYQRQREIRANEFLVVLCHYVKALKEEGHPFTHVLGVSVENIEGMIDGLINPVNLPFSDEFRELVRKANN